MTFHKYLVDSKMFEYDKHYRECQQLDKPFIKARIHPKTGNYFVQIDLMTCSYNLSNQEQDEIKKLAKTKMTSVAFTSRLGSDFFSIGPELVWFCDMSAEHVNDFCETVYDIIQKHHIRI